MSSSNGNESSTSQRVMHMPCPYPGSAPMVIHSMPAAYASLAGERYHRLGVDQFGRSAYGQSRPRQ